jgi:uncharacterized membrane protein YphA (DoxX/SURF4 family)
MSKYRKAFGVLFLRLLIGVIFFMQGYGKVFQYGLGNVYATAFEAYETILPVSILKTTLYFTSYAELLGGLLLILGFYRNYAIILLSTILIVVSFGHGLMQPIWDLQHVVFRALLLFPLYFLPSRWDIFHLDNYRYK